MIGGQTDAMISKADRELLSQAAAESECPTLSDCSPSKTQEFARTHSLDLATALIYDRVLLDSTHKAFFQQVGAADSGAPTQPTLIGIVPGAFYREHKNTGADGARLADILRTQNCRVERIPVDSFGSLTKNASLIAEWLTQHKHERVVLLSLSKGSADIKIALGMPNAAEVFRNVVAWISISGLPQGTPLVAWLRSQPFRRLGVTFLLWLRGQRYSVVEELRQEKDGPLADWPDLPPTLRLIHVVGFPLRRHLAHPWAARAYERVAPWGPSDGGGFLLADVSKLPGIIYPVWGADHYLQPSSWDLAPVFRAVLATALSLASAFRQASQSAAQPSTPPANKSTA